MIMMVGKKFFFSLSDPLEVFSNIKIEKRNYFIKLMNENKTQNVFL